MIVESVVKMGWYFEVGERIVVVVTKVVMVMKIVGDKVGYTLC